MGANPGRAGCPRHAKEQAMNSNTGRAVAGIAIIVVAVVLLIVLKNGGSDTSATTQGGTPIRIKNGKPGGGIPQLASKRGEQVRFQGESHVHDPGPMHRY